MKGSAATEITVAGQTVIVTGDSDSISAACRARTMSGDDGTRRFTDLDGDTVTVNIGAVAMIRAAKTAKATTGTFGFGRVLDGAA